jgi:hypothetical protein
VDSRRTIIVLSVCLAASLIAVGFLVGRESNRPTIVMSAPVIAPSRPVIEGPAVAELAPLPAAPPVVPSAPAAAPTRRPLAPAHTDAADTGDKAAVEHYFSVADRLQNADVADPEAAGGSLIAAATSGDLSGLRALTGKARQTEQTARALTPPASCLQFHKQLLHILAQNRELLQRLESGIGGGDVSALPALLEQANATKSHADALAREERTVKKRFGIIR